MTKVTGKPEYDKRDGLIPNMTKGRVKPEYDSLMSLSGLTGQSIKETSVADIVQVNQAINLTDQLISELDQAERQLSSARNWGFVDILGGGIITDLIKHSKLNNAKVSMDRVQYLLQELKRVLGGISMPGDYSMNVGTFATLADFFFDSTLVDAYMTAKIMSSLNEVRNLKNRCYDLRSRLSNIR